MKHILKINNKKVFNNTHTHFSHNFVVQEKHSMDRIAIEMRMPEAHDGISKTKIY